MERIIRPGVFVQCLKEPPEEEAFFFNGIGLYIKKRGKDTAMVCLGKDHLVAVPHHLLREAPVVPADTAVKLREAAATFLEEQ